MKKLPGIEPSLLGLVGPFTNIARAMSDRHNVEIIPSGFRCATDGRRIFIPFAADYLPIERRQLLHGMLDHEVCHVVEEGEHEAAGRATPTAVINMEKNAVMRALLNIVEDVRIEVKWSKRYPGVAENLNAINRDAADKYRADPKSKKGFWNRLGCAFIFKSRGIEPDWIESDVQDALAKLGPELEEVHTISWVQDSYDIAARIYKRLHADAEETVKKAKEAKEAKEKKEEKKEAKKPTPKGEEAEGEEAPEGSAGEESSDEADDEMETGSAPSEDGDDEGEDPEADDEDADESSDDSEESDDEDDGETDGESDDEKGEGEDALDEADDEGEEGSGGASDDEADDEEDDEADGGGSGAGEPSDDEDDDGEEGGDAGEGDLDGTADPGERAGEGEPSEEEAAAREVLSDAVDVEDVVDRIRDELEGSARKDVREHRRYVPDPAIKKADRWFKPVPVASAAENYRNARDQINQQIGSMRAKQLALIQTITRKKLISGRPEGRLDSVRLASVRTGSTDVFTEIRKGIALDTCFEVLIDLSGSMRDGDDGRSAAYFAKRTAIGLAESWDSLRIPNEFIGFTNNHERGYDLPRDPDAVHRAPFDFYVFKTWNERLAACRPRFASIRGYADNADGEAVHAAACRVAVRPEKRKILVVISDGIPMHAGISSSVLDQHLKDTVRLITRSGIEVIGVGAGTTAPANYYNKETGATNMIIKDMNKLASTLFTALRERMMR